MVPLVQTPLRINAAYRQMTVEEFLHAELEGRAELEEGVLYMMAGGSRRHAAVGRNILTALSIKLRGSSCEPFGSDMSVRTGPASLRMPDVSVYCGLSDDEQEQRAKLLGDPKVVFEVLSPSTRREDEKVKLPEYQALPGVELIVLVDPDDERVRIVEQTGPEAWADVRLPRGAELPIRALGISLSADEIFGRG